MFFISHQERPSKARKVGEFGRSMVGRDLHIQIGSRVAQVLRNQHSALFTDKESSLSVIVVSIWQNPREANKRDTHAESVAAHIVRADGQVADFEALDTMNIEALVNNASLWRDGVALSRSHAARAEAVPGCLNVTGNYSEIVRHHDLRDYQFPSLNLPHFSMCLISSSLYSKGARASCLLELRIEAEGCFPASNGAVQEPILIY